MIGSSIFDPCENLKRAPYLRSRHVCSQPTRRALRREYGPPLIGGVPDRTDIVVCVRTEVEDGGGLRAEEGAVFCGAGGGVGDVEVVLDVFGPDALDKRERKKWLGLECAWG